MIVAGSECIIFDDTGKTCTVNSFAKSAGSIDDVRIVDVAVAYDCPFSHKSYILLMRNALYVPELKMNLIPPFIMREGGLEVDECPKSQAQVPTVSNHSMYSKDQDLRIHFDLNVTFSCFNTRKPTSSELETCDKVFITLDSASWNPYSEHFSTNERAMLNSEGDLSPPVHKITPLINYDDTSYTPYPGIGMVDMTIDAVIDSALENNISLEGSLEDRHHLDNSIVNNTILGKIHAALGIMALEPEKSSTCPLFTGSINDLENEFSSVVSGVEAMESSGVSPSLLEKIWSISHKEATAVIDSTTQLNRQPNDGLLSRHFSTNDRMLRYKRINSHFFTDTMPVTKTAKSTRGNLYLQFFVSDKGYVAVYALEKKSDFKDALHMFCKDIGVPIALVCDPSGEQTSRAVRKFCHQVGTTLRVLEESTQWANRAELYIGLFKQAIRKDMSKSDSPMVLWDYCAERRALIHNLTPRALFQTDGQSPHQFQFGIQGDISNLCSFDWYDWCYYREEAHHLFPHQKELLGRVLGPSKNEGNEMAQNVLTHTGRVVPRRSVRRLTQAEETMETEKAKRDSFDAKIKTMLGDSMALPDKASTKTYDEFEFDPRNSDDDLPLGWLDDDPMSDDGKPIYEHSASDTLVNAEVLLPQ